MLKRLIYVIIVACLYQSIGFYVIAKIQEARLKAETAKFLKSSKPKKYQLIAVNGPSLKQSGKPRFINQKEFLWEGRMFDLVSTIKIHGNSYYLCYEDSKETNLKNLSTRYTTNSQSGKGSANNDNLLQQLSKLMVSNWFNNDKPEYGFYPGLKPYKFVFRKTGMVAVYTSPESPPPKSVLI
jgi:hypothetical protein